MHWTENSISVHRSFHCPTGLTAESAVDLVVRCKPMSSLKSAEINGRVLPMSTLCETIARWFVKDNLGRSNQIALEFSLATGNRGEGSCTQGSQSHPEGGFDPAESGRFHWPLPETELAKRDRFDLSAWAEVSLDIS
jgi:hypothetical protein